MFSLVMFMFCLNVAAWILMMGGLATSEGRYLVLVPSDISSLFNIQAFAADNLVGTLSSLALGMGIAGLVGIITRQGVYAAGVILIWVACIMFTPLYMILNGVPALMSALLPAEISWLGLGFQAFFNVIFFMFFIETFSQRQIT
jgi:hypothetical protein